MSPERRWLAPEVVQTSNMDCGPAALKCLLQGFGINAHYGHLRDACHTDVDGTSINTLEQVAGALGLDAAQMVVPVDHVLLREPGYLPALAVTRLPNGNTHFVVAWRRWGPWVQVMDPASGRRWPRAQGFLRDLHHHTLKVSPADWRAWAGGTDFTHPLCQRIKHLGLTGEDADALCQQALAPGDWLPLAFLDAAVRMLAALRQAGAIARGRETRGLLLSLSDRCRTAPEQAMQLVPENFWCARPHSSPHPPSREAAESGDLATNPALLEFTGAVLLRVNGVKKAPKPESETLARTLNTPPPQPLRELWGLLRQDGLLAPTVLVLAMFGSVFGLMAEVLLFRGLIDIHGELTGGAQRLGAVALTLGFMLTLLLVQYPAAKVQLVLGRQLENRLRMRFQAALPRIPPHFFHSRPASDTGERGHRLAGLREIPVLGGSILFKALSLLATAAGIIWLAPFTVPLVLLMAALQLAIPLAFQPLLGDHQMRVQTHSGALARFYMDALLGVIPIRTHGAGESVRRAHEQLLAQWAGAGRTSLGLQIGSQAIQLMVNTALASALVLWVLAVKGAGPDLLLLIYWVLALPPLGEDIATLLRDYPRQRNTLLRALEPLQAADSEVEKDNVGPSAAPDGEDAINAALEGPAALRFERVCVNASGRAILRDIDLAIGPGEHLAIVGESGAGKSSLAGLLLGWHRPASGRLLLHGEPLEKTLLARFRRRCAWVDPAVQLWNQSLLDNLHYGNDPQTPLYPLLQQAELLQLVADLPDGLQSQLGEGGALVSGGEGQRVRLGRALGRDAPACAILDEPFRGLDRQQRRQLLGRVRQLWRHSTLICISHDIAETQHFGRVLVVADGCIVEDGAPAALAADPESHYGQLLSAERELWADCWDSADWRHLRMEQGHLSEVALAGEPAREH
ncbi:ATP-binding cassette domain-containing protein [Microbulbifer sp. TYP-18]|uniref:ATP-binding cassette domain-containing protein n=1 Tax=Microbulbifer sp. TYP-18 TaxID=3230024 RepID=UPI0034C62D5B